MNHVEMQLATEAVAQCTKLNELLNELVEFQRQTLELQMNAMQEAKDPGLNAARQVAMMTGVQEVISLWNREHPLTPIQIQRQPAPGSMPIKKGNHA